MNQQLGLKELERKAFRSTYQDGLWDMYFGLIVICMSIFIYRPPTGYSPMNIVMAIFSMACAYSLFWICKRFITVPRMGYVEFGEKRLRRMRLLVISLSIVVLVQVILFVFQLLAWANPELGARIAGIIPHGDMMDLAVASIGALMVGPSMVLVAYFKDFQRGYFIAIMISVAVFLMLYLNQPIYPIVIGLLIAIPGIVLFIRFLRKYPLKNEGTIHG